MDRKYGYFSEDGKQYCITTPDIPRNWYNYLWNDRYIAFTSQTGAGEGFVQDNLGRRIQLTKDRGFFLLENGVFQGISGLPVNETRDAYLCTHRRGASDIRTEKNELTSEVGMIVPVQGNCELWSIKVKNTSSRHRSIRVVGCCVSGFDSNYTRQGYSLGQADFDKELGAIVSAKVAPFETNEKRKVYAFMASSHPVDGYDCSYNAIVGPYDSLSHPVFAERGGLSNTGCCGEKISFALQSAMDLAPNEEKEVIFVVGIAFDREEISEYIARFADTERYAAERTAVLRKFEGEVEQVSVNTPDEKLNCLFEWLKHQSNLGSRWARVRHNGFRDMTSDTDCLANINPDLALTRFLRILTYQYSNGYAPRTFIDGEIKDKKFSDNTVWLNFTAASIIKELGRPDILDMQVPYNDGTVGSVYEHLYRSVDFLYHFRGHHGLIRIWGGDWNDCMDMAGLNGKGASVWLSIAWYRANKVFTELAELSGKTEDAKEALRRGEELREIIEEYGWDGEYYLCAYNDNDEKIGSHVCEEGRMFLIPQLWSVLSGVSKNGREIKAMDAVEKYLSSPLGTLISIPAYTQYNPGIGSVTAKPAGVHENGGVYLHTLAWKIAADAMLGRADRVEQDIADILPFRNAIVNGRAEPYTLCNSYFGQQTGYRYGTPGQSWRTASGQWFQKALVNYVFGLMPELDGLRVTPCLPPSWKESAITKQFRGCTYHIRYINGGTKIKQITVNGTVIEGNLLPLLNSQAEVVVEME
ncbi:MAG: hypothetical protein IJY47_04690 [Clostridia bacterium]|nr:hypothetical protein [Clostridia bacterium]